MTLQRASRGNATKVLESLCRQHAVWDCRAMESVTPTAARLLAVSDVVRYSRDNSPFEVVLDGYPNYWHLQHAPDREGPRLLLESGINAPAKVGEGQERRMPVLMLRSSPWRAGSETTPWHDEYDLNHGHVRYFGDHKPDSVGPVGSTRGNSWLLEAWRYHASSEAVERELAPPVLLFRGVTVQRGGTSIQKGHLEFCGAGVIESLEYVLQRDPKSGRTFPNIVVDVVLVSLDENDELDWRWIDDRRNGALTAREALRYAPQSWRSWVTRGRVALPAIRRRVLTSRVASRDEQQPDVGSALAQVLDQVYHRFDNNKHAFEWLASIATARLLRTSGMGYVDGWITKAGGDGGMDFVGRLDVGRPGSNTRLVVLGQAKCVTPSSSISPDQVARLVARLRRGWIGVFVTTGVFSQQAQVEVIDDEYPVVLVHGLALAQQVAALADEGWAGDLDALLRDSLSNYPEAVLQRRPEEILLRRGS